MKNIYLTALLFGTVSLSGCGGGSSGGDVKSSSSTSEEAIYYDKWFKPSKRICENNGGEYNTNNEQECRADWENAKKICSISGDILPTIAQLKQVALDCGGELYIPTLGDSSTTERNQANSSYQACYKEKGFSSGNYHSSDTHYFANYDVWHMLYLTGYPNLTHEDISSCIRCIKGTQYNNPRKTHLTELE